MPNDVNIKIKAEGAEQAKRDINAIAQTADQMGQEVGQSGKKGAEGLKDTGDAAEKTKGKMDLLGHAVNSVKNYILGFASITALFAFFQKWLEYVKRIGEAQKELAESTKGLDQAAKSLASQANVMGTEEGMKAARAQVQDIQQRGNLTDWSLAEGIAVSAHSALGTLGQLLTPDQLDVASTVAGVAQRKGIDAGGADMLFKLMAKISETTGQPLNEEFAQQLIQQLSSVQQKSRAKSFGEFMPGAIKSMMTGMSFGVSYQAALSQYASALDIQPSADLAAEKNKQAYESMGFPSVIKAVTAKTGITEDQYWAMTPDQRLGTMGQWAASASQQEMLAAGVPPEKVSVLLGLYRPQQLERIKMFGGVSRQATSSQYREQAGGYSQTTQGKMESIEAENLRLLASSTDTERIGAVLMAAGASRYQISEARGKGTWWMSRKQSEQNETWEMLRNRYEEIERLQREEKLPNVAAGEIESLRSELVDIIPRPTNTLTPEETGHLHLQLRGYEEKAGITVNNYYNGDTIVAPGSADYGPRHTSAEVEN